MEAQYYSQLAITKLSSSLKTGWQFYDC